MDELPPSSTPHKQTPSTLLHWFPHSQILLSLPSWFFLSLFLSLFLPAAYEHAITTGEKKRTGEVEGCRQDEVGITMRAGFLESSQKCVVYSIYLQFLLLSFHAVARVFKQLRGISRERGMSLSSFSLLSPSNLPHFKLCYLKCLFMGGGGGRGDEGGNNEGWQPVAKWPLCLLRLLH